MVGSILLVTYSRYHSEHGEILETVVRTDKGFYSVNPLGIAKLESFADAGFKTHTQYSGEKIVDVRSDCETLLIQSERNNFILIGWRMDLSVGNTVQHIAFENSEKLDKNLIEWFDSMQQLSEENPRYRFD